MRHLKMIELPHLVSAWGIRSNTFFESLAEIDRKLEQLGLVELDGEIIYLPEGNSDV